MRLEDNFSFALLARLTPGFVGADLMSLTREAALIAVNRYNTLAILPLDHYAVSMFSEGPASSYLCAHKHRKTVWLKRIWFLWIWDMHLAPILSCPKPLSFSPSVIVRGNLTVHSRGRGGTPISFRGFKK